VRHEGQDDAALGAMWEQLAGSDPGLARVLDGRGRRSRVLAVVGRYLEQCGRAFVVAAPPINGPC
jgi:hypothetical protein